MANEHANKVIINGNTIIDLTGDSVSPGTLASGYTAHDASGTPIVGTMEPGEGGGGAYNVISVDNGDGTQDILITDAEGGVTVEPLSVMENGTYTAPDGVAYSPVTVSTPVVNITPLNVTANGTYTAPQGSAYSPVTVAIPVYDGSVT